VTEALDLPALIASRRPGYTLPAAFYLSAEIYQRDLSLIFGRHWIFVGVEPEIPEAGDLFTVDIGSDSIIIVRDDELAVRAFHNVCRHRGARLRPEGSGMVGNLVCPYHQWTYNLRGELVHNQHMGEDFDRCRFGLKPVHIRSLAGLLFICLAEAPAHGFDEMRAAIEHYIAPHNIANTKVAFQKDIIEHGNWKLTMENNRECYHCSANHPELTVSLLEYGFGYQPSMENVEQVKGFEDLLARQHQRWEACGLPSVEIDRLEHVTGFRTVRLPMVHAGESQTLDTKVASRKPLSEFGQLDLGGLSFWTQPNSWHHFMSDHIVSFSVLPISPHKALLRTRWLVHKDAVEGVDYDLKRLTEVWDATNDQDSALVANAHQGIVSSAYQPGPYSPYTEGLVDKFCNWYLDRLGAGLEQTGSAPAPPSARIVRPGPGTDIRPGSPSPTAALPAAPAAPAAPTAPATATDVRQFSITFSQSGHVVPCRADQTILSAAETAGLPLPFSCREGRCGTCRSRLVAGRVDMKHAGGIRQRQIEQGDILVCCSRPLSDLRIER
jgi:glycine betaine catabolism A